MNLLFSQESSIIKVEQSFQYASGILKISFNRPVGILLTIATPSLSKKKFKILIVSGTWRRRDIKMPSCPSGPSLVLFTFSIFNWKHSFQANLFPTFKSVCLKWNLVLRLIRIGRTQWWYLSFLGKIGPKNQNCQFKLKFSI